MQNMNRRARRIATLTLLAGLTALASSGCGGSSSTASSKAGTGGSAATTSATTARTGTTAKTPAPQLQGTRFAALGECVRRAGVTLPPGGGPPKLPSGMTRSQYAAIVRRCVGTTAASGAARLRAHLRSPAVRAALSIFAACMRRHQVNLPPPDTSGNGPVFDTSRLNTTSATFRVAQTACAPALGSAVASGGSR